VVTILGASITLPAVGQPVSENFPAERAVAQAMRDAASFVVLCVDGKITFLAGRHAATDTDWCNETRPLPMLIRARHFASGETMLLVLGTVAGEQAMGYVLRLDERSPRPLRLIGVGAIDDFGPVSAPDQIVIVNGEGVGSTCPMIEVVRALQLDWRRDQVSRVRLLSRGRVGCSGGAGYSICGVSHPDEGRFLGCDTQGPANPASRVRVARCPHTRRALRQRRCVHPTAYSRNGVETRD
jgi:hypothetical protein